MICDNMKNSLLPSWAYLALTFLVYLLVHLPMILLQGEWWDDYVAWNVTPQMLYEEFGPSNCNYIFDLHYLSFVTSHFSLSNQIIVFRMTSLIVHGISLCCVWIVLRRITENLNFSFLVCLLVATFGFDRTMFLTMCIHYAVANALFMIGLVLVVKHFQTNKRYFVYITAVLWFASLFVWRSPALLMPASLLLICCIKTKFSFRSYKSYIDALKYGIHNYWPILLGMVAFLVVYKLTLTPSGKHITYYNPTFVGLIVSPISAIFSGFTVVAQYIGNVLVSFGTYNHLKLFIIPLIICIFCYCITKKTSIDNLEVDRRLLFVSFGYMVLTFVLPLSIYGGFSLVSISEYQSRILSLTSFPIAVIVVLMLAIFIKKYFKLVYVIILSGSILYTSQVYIDYAFSLTKTEYLTNYLSAHPELDGKKIKILDSSFETNPNAGLVRGYEYEGMARLAYGPQSQTKFLNVYRNDCEEFNADYKMTLSQSKYPNNKLKVLMNKYMLKKEVWYNEYRDSLFSVKLEME